MSYGVTSDEVAEDYVHALQSLTMNTRVEISNLTLIAKENIEHALAISEALRKHIKQTSPQKKLPAFYVLDSIVKNVGTPYTLFFGRQLYATFMEAYVLVDNSTRRKMDEMLKTWKEPVPGTTVGTAPVFPPEVTRPIENALIKARTSAVQAQQQQMRGQQQLMGGRGASVTPYTETPTPPAAGNYGQPGYGTNYSEQQYPPAGAPQPYPHQVNGQHINGLPSRPPTQQYSPPVQQYPSPVQQYPQQVQSQQYIQTAPNTQYPYQSPAEQWQQPQSYPPTNPYGQQAPPVPRFPQQPAVLQQPSVLQQPAVPQHNQQTTQWQPSQAQVPTPYRALDNGLHSLINDIANLIRSTREHVAQQSQYGRTPEARLLTKLKALLQLDEILKGQQLPPDQLALIRTQVNNLSGEAEPPHVPSPQTYSPPPANAPLLPPPVPTPAAAASVLSQLPSLAALLARQSATPQPPVVTPTPVASTPALDPASILERLRKAGVLGGGTSTPPLSTLPGNVLPGFPPPLPFTPPVGRQPLAEIPNDVVLKPSSIKMFRPHLVFNLYERLGQPCNTCGRRFQTDEEGKKKKAAHLDWHFKVNTSTAEAAVRGQHRSWYADELEWIHAREVDDDQRLSNTTAKNGTSANASPAKPKIQYVLAPSANSDKVCPICQEKFETSYDDDLQEWIWLDAKDVGGRIFHASCHAEAYKDQAAAVKRGTPEPVLGKRKAEDDRGGVVVRVKVKTEPSP
ncbi:hypothetical protein BJ878DRAFT_543565 [Calycina marina]|uniref:CID domain-containing protein n=1 Tax=Calycina marina TaxID=1763456 RepID=A0A9P7Z0Q2_9HELO|nr:hypothetical protein BJ878DRAFT_543565 [Calycina marina]